MGLSADSGDGGEIGRGWFWFGDEGSDFWV